MNKKVAFLSLILVSVLLVGCSSSLASSSLGSSFLLQTTPQPTSQVVDYTVAEVSSLDLLSALQSTFHEVYADVNSSVVYIMVAVNSGRTIQTGEGSGFVWDRDGHIVTNNHVVEGASQLMVTFADGTTAEAEVVGTDPESDLAVIKVDPGVTELIPVTLADSQSAQVGDLVIAIGNPYGLSGTMTQGIISALSRSLTVDQSDAYSTGSYTIPDIIQTDAAINPGNSGGVLVDVAGQVLGVTSAIQSSTSSNSGIGFVIPSHIVARVVPVLIEDGAYDHPRLGITGTILTPDLAEALDLPADQNGVLIISVTRNGPAARAGLTGSTQARSASGVISYTGGDVIVAIDGQAIASFDDLSSYLFNNTEVGQTVSVDILRNGQAQTIEVTLAAGS